MAEKPKGNIIYEIFIVILIVGLIGTILYPAKVWKTEEESQSICRARMETIHNMELIYISNSGTNTYSDNVSELREVVFRNADNVVTMDTMLNWDGLVGRNDLKQLVLQSQFPEELRNYITTKVGNGEPLGNLAGWDSLELRLITELYQILTASEFSGIAAVDENIAWQTLVGDNEFQNILGSPEIPSGIRTNTQNAVRRGQAIFATAGWSQFRPLFYQSLVNTIVTAKRTDIWQSEEEDLWEEVKKKEWDVEMDTLSTAVRDSLWKELQQQFWEKEMEVLWKSERNKLWQNEKTAWTEENAALWDRSVTQQWESERKTLWQEESVQNLSDSLAGLFSTHKDSLWRTVVDSIRNEEYEIWKNKNKNSMNELIHTLWENMRRVTWQDETRDNWFMEMETDKDALWSRIKEEIWNSDRISLWRDEEIKLEQKTGALKRLDQSVKWASVLGMERVEEIINRLNLPDNQEMWKIINQGSSLNQLGIVGLFRNTLLDSLAKCPIAYQPYLIHVLDTSVVKYVGIRCPIVDTSDVVIALKVDPVSKDTLEVVLKPTTIQKLLGGGSIKNHGFIDVMGEKSWEKRGS